MNIQQSAPPRNTNIAPAPLKCPRCEHTGPPALTEAGPHIKATCAACGAYIKFLPRSDRRTASALSTILRLLPKLDGREKRELARVLQAVPEVSR